jgi:elongation factor Ts
VAEISAELVKRLRQQTGAGMMDCKKALVECGGNFDEAAAWLRTHGLLAAAKKSGRATGEGLVHAYIHPGGRVGVLIEVNCETDFVARTEDFQTLCKDLAMQVAAAQPRWVRREDVPAADLQREKDILTAQAVNEGKPEAIARKIVEGRLGKFYEENCLLDQRFVKNPDRTVAQVVQEAIAKLGENIVVRRFCRFALGEEAAE